MYKWLCMGQWDGRPKWDFCLRLYTKAWKVSLLYSKSKAKLSHSPSQQRRILREIRDKSNYQLLYMMYSLWQNRYLEKLSTGPPPSKKLGFFLQTLGGHLREAHIIHDTLKEGTYLQFRTKIQNYKGEAKIFLLNKISFVWTKVPFFDVLGL